MNDLQLEIDRRAGKAVSFPDRAMVEKLRPMHSTWEISYTDDAEEHLKQLERLGVVFAVFWNVPPRMEEWIPGLEDSRPVDFLREIGLYRDVRCSRSDFAILPDAIIDAEPDCIIQFVPYATKKRLWEAERDFWFAHKKSDLLTDIDTTYFQIESTENGVIVLVKEQTYKVAR